MLVKGHIGTIEEDDRCATITNKGLPLEIEPTHDDEELYNIEMVVGLGKDQAPFDFNPHSNLNENDILKNRDTL